MSIGNIGSYFDERAASWDKMSGLSGKKHMMIAQLAGVSEGSRVLDVGCGTGIMARAYIELGAHFIEGIDLSSKMIEQARENHADLSSCQLRFECADILNFESEEKFDVIVIYNAYPHILDKAALVEACAHLLKEHGRFLVAHGMGRAALNNHHSEVPEDVTSHLNSAREECSVWQSKFEIDMIADAPYVYFFGGALKK